jgi:hypothetical protein
MIAISDCALVVAGHGTIDLADVVRGKLDRDEVSFMITVYKYKSNMFSRFDSAADKITPTILMFSWITNVSRDKEAKRVTFDAKISHIFSDFASLVSFEKGSEVSVEAHWPELNGPATVYIEKRKRK